MKRLFNRFWPVAGIIVALLVLMGIMTALSLLLGGGKRLFLVLLVITLSAALAAVLLNDRLYRDVKRFITGVARELSPEQSNALDSLPTPVAVIGRKGEVIWYNRRFSSELLAGGDYNGGSIQRINKAFDIEAMRTGSSFRLKWGKEWYQCVPTVIGGTGVGGSVVYFHNITDLKQIEERFIATRPTVMMLVFDNEEELLKARESERVRVFSEVDALINEWADETAGICWANVRDKSLIIMEESKAKTLIDGRFSILEKARSISVEDGTPVTISIGVGRGGESIEECESWALQALDMALGRGGDQAVVRSQEGYSFFGGVSKSSERQSKVRIRMLASAFADLIETCDNCIVVGHRFTDLDSVGAAIGVSAIASALGRKSFVAVEEKSSLAADLIRYYRKNGSDCFLEPADALDRMRDNTLLVVVDTHSPGFVENRSLLERAANVVVIDHHRLMVDHIAEPALMIHEPFASSASEIVAELAGNMCERAVGRPEAEAMLAGIMLDTKSFVLRTGVRTFEAAAFLKRRGADTVEVKRLFAETLDTYTEKSRLVSAATLYKSCAIACAQKNVNNLRIVSSQAADDLLTISNVNASFVLFEADGCVNISARSFGKVNVQLIAEQLGGGGHLTMAGAQLRGVGMPEAVERLKAAIDHMR